MAQHRERFVGIDQSLSSVIRLRIGLALFKMLSAQLSVLPLDSPVSFSFLARIYEASVGFGDAPDRHAGSAANLQLLRTAVLPQQVVGRSNTSNSLRC